MPFNERITQGFVTIARTLGDWQSVDGCLHVIGRVMGSLRNGQLDAASGGGSSQSFLREAIRLHSPSPSPARARSRFASKRPSLPASLLESKSPQGIRS